MNCQDVKNSMLDFAEGKVSADLGNSIQSHLNSCTECESFFKLALKFEQIIEKEKALQVNPYLYTRVQERINSLDRRHTINLKSSILRTYYYYAAVIVVALFIGVFSGKQLGNLLSTKEDNVVITSESEQLKQDFYLNEIEKDDFTQVLNNQ
jgi:hypothetical protein